MFNFVRISGGFKNKFVQAPILKLTSDKRASRKDNMKNAKRILEKFDSWKYDIYESNKSDWTKQDDNDVNEIEKLLNEQAREQKG